MFSIIYLISIFCLMQRISAAESNSVHPVTVPAALSENKVIV